MIVNGCFPMKKEKGKQLIVHNPIFSWEKMAKKTSMARLYVRRKEKKIKCKLRTILPWKFSLKEKRHAGHSFSLESLGWKPSINDSKGKRWSCVETLLLIHFQIMCLRELSCQPCLVSSKSWANRPHQTTRGWQQDISSRSNTLKMNPRMTDESPLLKEFPKVKRKGKGNSFSGDH